MKVRFYALLKNWQNHLTLFNILRMRYCLRLWFWIGSVFAMFWIGKIKNS